MNANDLIETQAQTLRSRQRSDADVLLVCSCSGEHDGPLADAANQHQRLQIRTKCDLTSESHTSLATSAVTGVGIDALWKQLVILARQGDHKVTAGHAARSVHHLGKTLEHLHQASASVGRGEIELVALELRGALAELGDLTGAVFTDDLLDRIFSRFCIGK